MVDTKLSKYYDIQNKIIIRLRYMLLGYTKIVQILINVDALRDIQNKKQ